MIRLAAHVMLILLVGAHFAMVGVSLSHGRIWWAAAFSLGAFVVSLIGERDARRFLRELEEVE